MKYIRTKEGNIYKRLFIDRCLDRGTSVIINGEIMPYKEDVIAEADTIEELCDCYVIIIDGKPCLTTIDEWSWYFEEYTLYACIWVTLPNGAPRLEPVAKMNEKGELELL